MAFSSKQWVAIGSAAVLFTSLFFINRKPPKPEGMQQGGHTNGATVGIDSILNESEAQIPLMVKAKVKRMETVISSASTQIQEKVIDSIIILCDSVGAQLPLSYYTEKLAMLDNSTDTWYRAGDSYYKCAELANNASRSAILQRAMQCFDNSIKADSTNLAAKVGKGECIVQGGGPPMQGIQMIEAVLKQDSNNEKAQIALGSFSIQSGQFPKAIMRFKKVLKIDPTFVEAYLYLAQASEGAGDKNAAIGYLKKYSTFARDSAVKVQVSDYIKKLEGDTTAAKQ